MKVKLTDVCDIKYGYAFDSKCFVDDESCMPLIRIRDVKRGFSETYYSGIYSDEHIINTGDLLIGMDGEFNIARWKSSAALLNQRVCKITAKPEICEEYIRFILSIKLKEIERRTAFVTVKHLSAKELNKLELDIPEYEIQVKIADILQRVECILDHRNSELVYLNDLIKSRFVEMFGDPVINEKGYYVDTLQHLIEKEYITYHLDGNHGGEYPRSEEYVESGVPYIGANCISGSEIDFKLAKYLTPERASRLRKGIARNEDVLFANNATVGPVVVLHTDEEKVILSTSLTSYRCNQNYLKPNYLKGYMLSEGFVNQYLRDMKQTTRNQVPITQQRKYWFMVPPIEEQTRFEAFVNHIDKLKVKVQQSLDETQTLFNCLMQEYFG